LASINTPCRHLGLDILRILSAVAVIIIHVAAPIMTTPVIFEQGDFFWWFSNILDSLSRFSVPMFVILSGYSYSIIVDLPCFRQTSRQKFMKLVKITLFWSLVFIIYRLVKGDFSGVTTFVDLFILALVKPLLAGLPYFHLWYLYMALGLFYCATFAVPFLNALKERKVLPLLLSVMFFCLFFSFQNYYYDNKLLFVFWFLEYIFYFMFGFYITKLNICIKKRLSLTGFVLVVILNSVLIQFMIDIYGADRGQYFYEFVSPFVLLQTIFLFTIFMKVNIQSPMIVVVLSRLSLPVYLVHPFITEAVVPYVQDDHSIVSLFVGIIISVFFSFLVSYFLYRIPGVRRFVF